MTLRRTSLACSALLFAVLAPKLSQSQPVDAGEVVERAIALHRERAEGITGYTQKVRLEDAGDRMSSIATEGMTFGAEIVGLTVERRRSIRRGSGHVFYDSSLGESCILRPNQAQRPVAAV